MNAVTARNIRLLAKWRELSLQQIADQAGISRAVFNNVLNGTNRPNGFTGNEKRRIANALQVSTAMLDDPTMKLVAGGKE